MKPMLAGKCEGLESLKYPVLVSVKLDGVRALVIGGKVMSRSLKPIPNAWGPQPARLCPYSDSVHRRDLSLLRQTGRREAREDWRGYHDRHRRIPTGSGAFCNIHRHERGRINSSRSPVAPRGDHLVRVLLQISSREKHVFPGGSRSSR